MLHDGVGIDTGEDEALLEGVVEATVLGMGEPDEIGSSVVGRDAVEMMDFVAASELRADPCERHKSVASSTSCLSDREVVLSPSAAISSVDSISVWFNGTQAVAGEGIELCITRTVDGLAFSSLEWAETYYCSVCCCEFRWERVD